MNDSNKKDPMLRLARIEPERADGHENDGEDERPCARVVFRLVSPDSLAPQFDLEGAEVHLPTSYEVALVPGPEVCQ